MGQNFFEAAHTFDFAKAIQNAQICLQIKVLKARAQFIGQFEREFLRSHSMAGMQLLQDPLKAEQIFLSEPTANIHVLGDKAYAVGDGRIAAHQNKFDTTSRQRRQHSGQIIHGGGQQRGGASGRS